MYFMQLNKILLSAIAIFGMTSVAYADQGHGSVTFSGSVIESPCSINPDSVYQDVPLGQISTVTLKDGGTSDPRPFQIKLENCTVATAAAVTATFSGPESATGLLGMTGTVKGASIAITDGTGAVLKLGSPSAKQVLQTGYNTLSFSAYVQGDGKDVTPGEFQSIADFTLAYQ